MRIHICTYTCVNVRARAGEKTSGAYLDESYTLNQKKEKALTLITQPAFPTRIPTEVSAIASFMVIWAHHGRHHEASQEDRAAGDDSVKG
jgi:hypothetical protein